MVSTYILDIDDFTNRADITGNLQTAKLKSILGVVQEKYAPKILCNALYDQLLVEIAAGTLTTANTSLLPYLKDYLIYKSYSRYLLNSGALSTPSGMRQQVDTTSQPISDQFLADLIQQAKNDANFYQDQLVNFLVCNDTDYPLWTASNCGCSKPRTKNKNQFSMVGKEKFRDDKINWS